MSEGRIHIDGLKHADVALLKAVASEAAEQAVTKTFLQLGIDTSKPLEAQADMLFLRAARQGVWKAVVVAFGLVGAGAVGMFWVGFKASLKITLPLLALVALMTLALAKDDGRYASSPHKDWVNGLKDKKGNGCCDTSDGYPAEVEWDTERAQYRVRIDGAWYPVPPDALLTEPNRLGYAMVWYWRQNGVPQIRCFIPGAGT